MRKLITLTLAGAALAAGGVAYAQSAPAAGEVTRAQVQSRAAQAFGRIDANGDGVLDQADRQTRQKAVFDRIDADRDGAISFTEFASLREQRQEARGERRQARIERRQAAVSGARPGGLLGRNADANSDGAITQAEFNSAALARFERADANDDGTVTAEERRAARPALPGGRRARNAG